MRGKRMWGWNCIWGNNDRNLPKFSERQTEWPPKRINPKNSMPRNTRVKPMKTKIVNLLFTSLIWPEIMLENNIIIWYLVC